MQGRKFWSAAAGAVVTMVAFPSLLTTSAPASQAVAPTTTTAVTRASDESHELPSLDNSTTTASPSTAAPSTTIPRTTTSVPPAPVRLDGPDPAANTELLAPIGVPLAGTRDELRVIGRIIIPAMGLNTELREGIAQNVIDAGPAHWPGTATPGGEGNVVVAGHRSTHSQPFHDSALLRPGDSIVFETASGWRHTYRIDRQFVVESDALWIKDQHPGHTVTLFTCHPIGSSRQRLVTIGTLISSDAIASQ